MVGQRTRGEGGEGAVPCRKDEGCVWYTSAAGSYKGLSFCGLFVVSMGWRESYCTGGGGVGVQGWRAPLPEGGRGDMLGAEAEASAGGASWRGRQQRAGRGGPAAACRLAACSEATHTSGDSRQLARPHGGPQLQRRRLRGAPGQDSIRAASWPPHVTWQLACKQAQAVAASLAEGR